MPELPVGHGVPGPRPPARTAGAGGLPQRFPTAEDEPEREMMDEIRLELARDRDMPEGSPRRGYLFRAPLDAAGRLDADAWKRERRRCTVTRFWDGEVTELGTLALHGDGQWVFDFDPADDSDDEPGYRFGEHIFRPGEYVSVREHDGAERTFRVVSCVPMPDV